MEKMKCDKFCKEFENGEKLHSPLCECYPNSISKWFNTYAQADEILRGIVYFETNKELPIAEAHNGKVRLLEQAQNYVANNPK